MKSKVTIPSIINAKKEKRKISMLTAYDYLMAKILDEAEIDILLVGDSVGFVHMGLQSTIPVTMDQMVYHSSIVAKATQRALVITDMPFGSYTVSKEEAVRNAGQLIKYGKANAVKIEGGREYVQHVIKMVQSGIPVMGHIGLKPQSLLTDSGYKIHGKKTVEAIEIYKDAIALEGAGAFAIVLEGIPVELAKIITKKINIPTIGIGAGQECDGQIQVFHDITGLFNLKLPRHAKKYINNHQMIKDAIATYCQEVENKNFPEKINSVSMDSEELIKLQKNIEDFKN